MQISPISNHYSNYRQPCRELSFSKTEDYCFPERTGVQSVYEYMPSPKRSKLYLSTQSLNFAQQNDLVVVDDDEAKKIYDDIESGKIVICEKNKAAQVFGFANSDNPKVEIDNAGVKSKIVKVLRDNPELAHKLFLKKNSDGEYPVEYFSRYQFVTFNRMFKDNPDVLKAFYGMKNEDGALRFLAGTMQIPMENARLNILFDVFDIANDDDFAKDTILSMDLFKNEKFKKFVISEKNHIDFAKRINARFASDADFLTKLYTKKMPNGEMQIDNLYSVKEELYMDIAKHQPNALVNIFSTPRKNGLTLMQSTYAQNITNLRKWLADYPQLLAKLLLSKDESSHNILYYDDMNSTRCTAIATCINQLLLNRDFDCPNKSELIELHNEAKLKSRKYKSTSKA